MLLEGHSLEEAGVQPNDTVIAVIPSGSSEDKEEKAPVAEVDGEAESRVSSLSLHVMFAVYHGTVFLIFSYCVIFSFSQMTRDDVKN